MEDAHARREGRFGRGEASDASGNAQPLRLAELERERAALAMFAGVAAHELTVPLIAAETHARLLEEQLAASVDGFSSADLEELFRSLSRMRLLVATLLHDARCAGQPLERGPVSLQRLVDAGAELLARDVQARRARIVTGDLPVVDADEVLLGGVVNNLLLNALRYGPLSGGEIRVDAHRAGTQWRVSVTSQGVTIPRADRERIFEPLTRGAHGHRIAGAGLGLAICRSIVERHGGAVGVEPAPGGGNRFYFTVAAVEEATESGRRYSAAP